MPSNAYSGRLVPLLRDAEELNDAYTQLLGVRALQHFAAVVLSEKFVHMFAPMRRVANQSSAAHVNGKIQMFERD